MSGNVSMLSIADSPHRATVNLYHAVNYLSEEFAATSSKSKVINKQWNVIAQVLLTLKRKAKI
jgi:hypothetical protein